ncbi:MAG: hypothetical protein C3F07_10485 [Anaerolineales bacterium]|nr:hypothetical protein [Anaerolineae bacterium]PWB73063.1 MAG: hypothetical protein C3F07_10485 [Anaerolineales bacterium]
MESFLKNIRWYLSDKSLKAIEILILGILLFWGYTRDLGSVVFFPDENFWTASSIRFDKLLSADFDSHIWTENQVIAFEVRPVPSYLTGFSQRLGGVPPNDQPVYWNWGLTEAENIVRGAMPGYVTLWWSRLPMAIISTLSLLLTTLFLARYHSRLSAYAFTWIGFNGYFLTNLRRAMSEASILFFTVLAMAASYKLITAARERNLSRSIQWSLIVGLFSGLAGQSKLTGLACAGIAIFGSFLVTAPNPSQWLTLLKQRVLLIVVFLVTVSTLATFILSYPFFYTNTVNRIWGTFDVRDQIVKYQLHTYTDQLIPPDHRLAILFERILDYPLHVDSHQALGLLFHWLNLLIVVIGISYTIKHTGKGFIEQDYGIILLLGALFCVVPMLFTPFDWERYYLFPVYFSCIFFAIGIGQLILKILEKTK